MSSNAIQPWDAAADLPIVAGGNATQIATLASPQLSERDIRSIALAFDSGSYEMAATFVWTKAAAVLKRQVAALGMEFVGEMLNRADITEDSDPATVLSDREAVSLAEDLGMVSPTLAFRLNQALGLVTHFTRLPPSAAEAMEVEEAVMLLKTCVAGVLARPNFDGALHFADFRKKLSSTTLRADECMALQNSPYFFLRTTLSVLLSLIKTEKGASHEHALGNVGVILPLIWPKLRDTEKWQVGQTYAELMSEGKRSTSAGLKAALLQVHGFDFVPESLRSNTFTEAAARVLAAHFGWNNFFTEEEPMLVLANLGTAIPKPAFAKCMEATTAVWLGNRYGHAFASQEPATRIFNGLRLEQWEYYINECLPGDKSVLDKLAADERPIQRWISLVTTYLTRAFPVKDKKVFKLLEATSKKDLESIKSSAIQLRKSA
jgi:hypothetical protein